MSESYEYIGNELDVFKKASNWKSYFAKHIKSALRGDVLEVGSGIGANTPFLLNASDNILSWTLVEPDKDLLEVAKTELCKDKSNIPFSLNYVNGTIESVFSKKYDTILYIDVIEHIEDAVAELSEAKTLLKKDGRLIILVPAYQFLFNNFDRSIGHFRRYNKKMLKGHVHRDLEIKRLFYLDSMGFFAALLNKWVLKKDIPTSKNIFLWDKILVPFSKVVDIISFHSFGKSLIGIFANVNSK
ncbi:hypothetical protein MTsPCn5_32470 [Croceitalea sp. MTPC5]|uniref:class I SAM-dependent methyltransferase n=1 Tax=Croceitalea sp. MTPC5 TaxID=3056565 RepID=UPI002B3806EF|nr:hypothetical protein MTsPCn5_32470 [Croceitalea sp. MTPC5]